MKLYYAETLNARKACAVARHLSSPAEFVPVRLGRGEHKRPAFLALNPNGRVPVLQQGDYTLWESNAIMCHLSVEAGADLWPRDARSQVEVTRWLSWDSHHFTRHTGELYFQRLIKPALGLGLPDSDAEAQATQGFMEAAGVLEAHLHDRDFLLGRPLSVADFAVSAALPYATDIRLPLESFPAIRRWHARLQDLPGWREPFLPAD
jgi:glutathione S-transferase